MITLTFRHTFLILVFSLLIKGAYLIVAYAVFENDNLFSVDGYSSILDRNDTGWYQRIAENWYPEITNRQDLGFNDGKANFKQSEWAFFPFYPWSNRKLMSIFNISFHSSGLILSIIFSSLAFIGFYLFSVNFIKDKKAAFYSTLVFIAFPFHYYFSMMYTEAVFFTFLIFAFIAVFTRKYAYIPLLIIPLILTRPFGFIALISIYLFYLEREGLLQGYQFQIKEIFSKRNFIRSLVFASGPLAFLLYCFYQKQMTGEFFAFSVAQAGWYRKFTLPIFSFFRRGDFVTQFQSFYTIAAIIISFFVVKRIPLSLKVFVFLSLIFPLFSGSVQSMTRFISVVFPFSILLGYWLYRLKLVFPAFIIFTCLHLFVFYFWLIGHPFSF